MAPKPRRGGEPRQRYTAEMKKLAIKLYEGDYKGRTEELREHLRRRWKLPKPLPKQTLNDWLQPKAKQTIHETAKKGDGGNKAVRFAKYPELEDLLLPRILPLEDAGVLTIDILREQAKKLLPSVTFKPDKNGRPKAPPQLSVGWAWKVCRRFGLMSRKRTGEAASADVAAATKAKLDMPKLLKALGCKRGGELVQL